MKLRVHKNTQKREYLTIILRGCAAYEMIYNQEGALRRVGYYHFTSSNPEENNFSLKTPTTQN